VTIVVDLGCMDRPPHASLPELARAYKPDLIYGFDPSPLLDTSVTDVDGTPVRLVRSAAWTRTGAIGFREWGIYSYVGCGGITVPCFNFSHWLNLHGPCVVKMDVEGAEYQLLEQIVDDGTDDNIVELLIEWHDEPDARLLAALRCPVKEWWL